LALSSALGDPDDEPLETPSKFGPYEVVREIGRGGMAIVYEGRHPKLDSRVALKVLHPLLAAQPSSAARFLREAEAASQIRHQNVVQVFDVGMQDGLPFIVMEFLEGADLATLLTEKGPMPLNGVVDTFLPVISAVGAAHRAGIIHRDLKPSNLMLAHRPPWRVEPVVLDFGISKVQSEDLEQSKLTRSESLLGTVPYMAPEVTRGAKLATAASDQYALGVMLYECATGTRPFAGESQYELMHAIVTALVAPPSSLQPKLPPAFDDLVMTAMHRDPAKRYASLDDLGAALLSLGDTASWARWKSVFLPGDQEQSPWAASTQTVSDADALPAAKFRRPRAPKVSLAGWGLLGMTCVAAGTTMALVVSRRAPGPEPVLAGQTAASPAPTPTAQVEAPAAAPITTTSAVAPAIEPVTSAPAPVVSSSPRRRATGAPLLADSVRALPPPLPSASARVKAAPQRGTHGVPIFE
jgi:serine/threonine-protein kinase